MPPAPVEEIKIREVPQETQPLSGIPLKRKTPRYAMRFIPDNESGALKKKTPKVGGERGPEAGDIWGLPLEYRHETWWELINEADVPPEELKRDQAKRDIFMQAAKKSDEERAKTMRAVGVPIRCFDGTNKAIQDAVRRLQRRWKRRA